MIRQRARVLKHPQVAVALHGQEGWVIDTADRRDPFTGKMREEVCIRFEPRVMLTSVMGVSECWFTKDECEVLP